MKIISRIKILLQPPFIFFLLGLIFIVGFLVGRGFTTTTTTTRGTISFSESRENTGSRFTNPLLECEFGDAISNPVTDKLGSDARDFIKKYRETHPTIIEFSFYFRDLNDGPWFGYHYDKQFYPSSLLKVPLMMAVLKEAEVNPSFLNEIILFKGDTPKTSMHIAPSSPLVVGKQYKVSELVEIAIRRSDNDAAFLLAERLGERKVEQVYRDLGLADPENSGNDFMDIRQYATFFRILYNSSYLSQPASEAALGLLATTEFTDGIRAGVPDDILVSHKFGERIGKDTLLQFHDCGIVYVPSNPYLICAMTRGNEFEDLVVAVRDLSKYLYEKVNSL